MQNNRSNSQETFLPIFLVWLIFAVGIMFTNNQQTSVLGLAVLIIVVMFTFTSLFPRSSQILTLVGSIVYLVVYYSIYPFTWASISTPLSTTLIFFITEALGSSLLRKMNENYHRLQTNIDLLNNLVQYDSETGLLKPQYLYPKLDDELTRSRRFKHQFSIVMLQVKNGADAGIKDGKSVEIEQMISKLLVQNSRTRIDTPFLQNHFGVILPETNVEGAIVFANRLLEKSAQVSLHNIQVGISTFPNDAITTEELVKNCEAALQKAQMSGRAIVRYDEV
ncbi:MAG: diguanylate cyclase [Anaerolineaceae bacterium]